MNKTSKDTELMEYSVNLLRACDAHAMRLRCKECIHATACGYCHDASVCGEDTIENWIQPSIRASPARSVTRGMISSTSRSASPCPIIYWSRVIAKVMDPAKTVAFCQYLTESANPAEVSTKPSFYTEGLPNCRSGTPPKSEYSVFGV